MSATIEPVAADGHTFNTYQAHAKSNGPTRGGLAVIQEVLGANQRIRDVCDGFTVEGHAAPAPSLLDRIEAGVECDYDQAGLTRGRELRAALDWAGQVGVGGYCWSGSIAWLAATRLDPACAVGYYGGQIAELCGETDAFIPLQDVEPVRAARPDVPVYLYPAGHGFNCNVQADHYAESAVLAGARTLEFFARHLG